MGAPKQKWTQEEEGALKAGVVKHGAGKWRTILKDPEFSGVLYLRSNVDLKDKWRNMSVMANGWGSRDKARVALRRIQPVHKYDDSTTIDGSVQSDDEVTDHTSLPGSSDMLKKPMEKLENLIMDAIINMKEAGGSNKTTIATYIEEQYWAPPDFKRILSTKLKFLTANGRLIKVKRKYRIAPPTVFYEKRHASSLLPYDGRMADPLDYENDEQFMLRKSEVESELAEMRSMTPKEMALAAARAVAEAEAAIAEAEEATREAEAAEADAEEKQAFADAAAKTFHERHPHKAKTSQIMRV